MVFQSYALLPHYNIFDNVAYGLKLRKLPKDQIAEKGNYGIACAFATILIVITYGSVLLMNLAIKHFGTSKKLASEED